MTSISRTLRITAATAAVFACALAPLSPAQASTVPHWGVWTAGESSGTGTVDFGDTTLPSASFDVTGAWDAAEIYNVTDESEWFTSETPIGSVFGANGPSSSNNFLKVTSVDNVTDDAVVTVTFSTPTIAGNFAFAVTDIDTDYVSISAKDPSWVDGEGLSGETILGSATDQAFNFCDVSDSPGGCSETAVPGIYTYSGSVLVKDNGPDDGSSAWFRPDAAISSITFEYRNLDETNSSSFRIWMAQLAPEAVAPLADTGVSPSVIAGMFGFGAALLAAGGLLMIRRRRS